MQFTNEATLVANGCTPQTRQKRADILSIFKAAVDAVEPGAICKSVIEDGRLTVGDDVVDLTSFSRLYLIAFGKASLGMAKAVSALLPISRGVVISPTAGPPPAKGIEVHVGGHPLPTKASLVGTEKALDLLQHCGSQDGVLVLISGGGSSLFAKPRVPLKDLRQLTSRLLDNGAPIEDMNVVRKHLSSVKGGQLLGYTKATVITLIISDVVHDPLESIASGPTAPDPSTFHDAVAVLKKYGAWDAAPASIRGCLTKGMAGAIPETPKPGDPCFKRVKNFIIANNVQACHAAALAAMERGYSAIVLTHSLTGEAREVGQLLVQNAKDASGSQVAFIVGGETTVRVTGRGKGGRNQELVLGAVRELAGSELVLGSLATDGQDGYSPAAGALADGLTLQRAEAARLDPDEVLALNDSYSFFSLLGDALLCAPTGTNVMDLQVILR